MKPIDHYEAFGYSIFRGFFEHEEISLINKHVDRIFQKWFLDHEAEIFTNKIVNMHSLTSPEYFRNASNQRIAFFNAIASIKLTEALESLFGSGLYFQNTQLFFNPTNRERLPYWHRDMQYSPIADTVQSDMQRELLTLHIRIPLVDEKGMELVKGSHKRWDTELERNVRFERKGHKNCDSLPHSVLIDLVPGDILIFDAQMIHRGNYEQNSTRKAFDLCVGKYHPLSSNFLDERVLPTQAEMERIKNNQWYKLAREITAQRFSKKDTPTFHS